MNQPLETLADVLIRILAREAAEAESVSNVEPPIKFPVPPKAQTPGVASERLFRSRAVEAQDREVSGDGDSARKSIRPQLAAN